jgi:hypothetical protein
VLNDEDVGRELVVVSLGALFKDMEQMWLVVCWESGCVGCARPMRIV